MGFEQDKKLDEKYVMPTFGRYPVEFVKGEGMHLFDSEGKRYLDFLSGIGVCSLGHCHPAVANAIVGQAEELIHVSNYFYIEKRSQVAERLSSMLSRSIDGAEVPEDAGTWKSFFANSGAEANECAIKLARIHYNEHRTHGVADTREPIVVTLEKSFHGRTIASLTATGQPRFHKGFEPIPAGFAYVPINDTDALRAAFDAAGDRICAVMVECIQGESGVHPCNGEFLQEVRRLCTQSGALMICDEVQSGIYRTGLPFAFQHFCLVPDIVTTAKGIASGVPAAACSARAALADELGPGSHGSTFGGSNLAMSAALATLEELDRPEVARRVTEVGAYLAERLAQIAQVTEVRGYGLMLAAELEDGIEAHDVVAAGLERGIVLNAPGPSTLRLLPPLVCTAADVDEFIAALTATLER